MSFNFQLLPSVNPKYKTVSKSTLILSIFLSLVAKVNCLMSMFSDLSNKNSENENFVSIFTLNWHFTEVA